MKSSTASHSSVGVFSSFWIHRRLILQMTMREVIGRYRGSIMGILWSLLNPMLMLAVYTFVFSVVFQARWGEGENSKIEFAVILFVGMIIHGLFAECANRAPGLILSNVNYVKKVVFPLEILPWVAMGTALFHAVVSVGVLLAAFALIHHGIHWTSALLPMLLLPLVMFTMGVSWLLASLGVFLRDVGHTTGIITTVMLFLSPVFFPVSALPEVYQPLMLANPLTFIIEQARDILIWGKPLKWIGLGVYLVASLLVAWAGLYLFQKMRKGFADVL
jgi:lipopolysaccharide transport system permease protein